MHDLIKYDYDQLNELCNKISLLEYAEKSYDFKNRGGKYYCSCPKHSDSDPSLCISPDVNLFYCFSCGRGGNLINWLMEYEDMDFSAAIQKVSELTGSELREYTESTSMNLYRQLSKLCEPKNKNIQRIILDIDKDYHQKYKDESPEEWLNEGISEEELKKYDIRIDPTSNRIVYPVFSNDDKLISVKGRTRFKNFKDLKIMKYINYYKLGGRLDYFQGMQQARDSINSSGEIIIVEGIKSVMKLDQWGFHNVVSAETSKLNEYQIELLIRMKVRDVVIAFDKDVQMKKIRECTELLKRFTNVYVVYDRWGLLQDKDSPCDQGREVWQTLYDKRIKL